MEIATGKVEMEKLRMFGRSIGGKLAGRRAKQWSQANYRQ